MNLFAKWLELKQIEANAAKQRREIEDMIAHDLQFKSEIEGTQKAEADGFKIKAVGRITRKVDGDKLQEVAAENGLSAHLSTLFRWKPEINAAVWKATDESITNVLSQAVTAKPGRLSFTIEKTEE